MCPVLTLTTVLGLVLKGYKLYAEAQTARDVQSLSRAKSSDMILSDCARMAELADALGSGPSPRKGVEVRVLFRAPSLQKSEMLESDRR